MTSSSPFYIYSGSDWRKAIADSWSTSSTTSSYELLANIQFQSTNRPYTSDGSTNNCFLHIAAGVVLNGNGFTITVLPGCEPTGYGWTGLIRTQGTSSSYAEVKNLSLVFQNVDFNNPNALLSGTSEPDGSAFLPSYTTFSQIVLQSYVSGNLFPVSGIVYDSYGIDLTTVCVFDYGEDSIFFPWVFSWNENGSSDTSNNILGCFAYAENGFSGPMIYSISNGTQFGSPSTTNVTVNISSVYLVNGRTNNTNATLVIDSLYQRVTAGRSLTVNISDIYSVFLEGTSIDFNQLNNNGLPLVNEIVSSAQTLSINYTNYYTNYNTSNINSLFGSIDGDGAVDFGLVNIRTRYTWATPPVFDPQALFYVTTSLTEPYRLSPFLDPIFDPSCYPTYVTVPCFIPICIVKGTKIETPDGQRLIEDLKEGDSITVVRSGQKHVSTIQQILTRVYNPGSARLYTFNSGSLGDHVPNEPLTVTGNHLVFNERTGKMFHPIHSRYCKRFLHKNDDTVELFNIAVHGDPYAWIIANGATIEAWDGYITDRERLKQMQNIPHYQCTRISCHAGRLGPCDSVDHETPSVAEAS